MGESGCETAATLNHQSSQYKVKKSNLGDNVYAKNGYMLTISKRLDNTLFAQGHNVRIMFEDYVATLEPRVGYIEVRFSVTSSEKATGRISSSNVNFEFSVFYGD